MDARYIETAGGRTRVRVYEGGDGPALLYLHGAGGVFPDDPFLALLAKHFRVSAPLLPGYEDSEGADNLRDMLDVALHCFDVMDALGLDRPLVVGHSMGGMIAAEMAAVAPKAVDRLALLAPAGLWFDQAPLPDLFAKLPFELPALLFHDVALGTKMLTAGLDLDDPDFLTEFLIMNARRFGMAGKLLFPIPDRGLSDRMYRIKARTAVIWGANDGLIPETPYAQAFVDGIAGAKLTSIPAAGHLLQYEQAEAVLAAIQEVA
ncbi:MAG: alpha/beta fold hydrolase [Alphaproteobacteria bacterium]